MCVVIAVSWVAGACNQNSDKVAELERRLAAVERATNRRLDAVEGWLGDPERKTVTSATSPSSWWCTIECFRSKPDCEADDAAAVARTQYSKLPKQRQECSRQRVAWCGGTRCFAEYGMCLLMEKPNALCPGVE